jgi:hypothetical protein
MSKIAAASESQAHGIEAMHRAVTQIDQVTQKNAAGAEQSASSSQMLSGHAAEMRALVGQFQLTATTSKVLRLAPTQKRASPSVHGALALSAEEASDF